MRRVRGDAQSMGATPRASRAPARWPDVRFAAVVLAPSYVWLGACLSARPAPDGACEVAPPSVLDCAAAGYDGGLVPANLVGYSCTGSARPDEAATFLEGVPRGLVCADRGPVGDGTAQGYCCTSGEVDCAYDPLVLCQDSTYGYQCRGWNRPESLNPAITCGNGVEDGDLIDYCCTGMPSSRACQQSDTLGCSARMLGFLCRGDDLPRGENLGANLSRADFYYPVCSTPQPAANPEINSYCCYMPALVPVGGTCVSHTKVPGCAPGRFGFACYGPDTPEEDFLPMSCPHGGVPGTSAEGYPATLYCCDFQ